MDIKQLAMSSRIERSPNSKSFLDDKNKFTSFGKEIVETLFDSEKDNIKLNNSSKHLPYRPLLIQEMIEFRKYFQFSNATLHLGKIFQITPSSFGLTSNGSVPVFS
jgi:hypothetical protein